MAAAIESRYPAAADENAALIAEHLETAGDLHAAYGWHMRAATWATYRDIAAARQNWERAEAIADALPAEDPNRAAMRIAPRTMLCGIAWRVQANVAGDRFEELRELCTAAGDKASLAIGMAGLVIDHGVPGPDPRGVAAGVRSLGPHRVDRRSDADGGAVLPGDLRQGSQRRMVMTCCGGRNGPSTWPTVTRRKANLIFGSPLALAFTTRAYRPVLPWSSRMASTTCADGVAMARSADPLSYATGRRLCLLPGNTVWRAWLPMIRRCARSRMPCGLPNDPVTIWRRWSSPGRYWASRWCIATGCGARPRTEAPGGRQRRDSAPRTQPERVTAHQRVLGA